MADTVVCEAVNSNSLFGRDRAETMPKRKTPSQLRGEQLKRRSFEVPADTKLTPLLAPHSVKKSESSRNRKYIDTRLNEHFPVRKSSSTCRGIQGQDKPKTSANFGKTANVDLVSHLPGLSAACNVSPENKEPRDVHGKSDASENSSHHLKSLCNMRFQKTDNCSESTLRSVAQLSIGKQVSFDSTRINMDKALKGLVARDSLGSSGDSSGVSASHPSQANRKNHTEYNILGQKTPLDFTLKSTMRLVSSSSVKWLHRLTSSGMYNDIGELNNLCNGTEQCVVGQCTSELLVRKALHSWKYPQSSLPSSVVSAMSLSASSAEASFLKKRYRDWEDSFHNLYYMLRQKKCMAFYAFTPQFVALFVSDFSRSKRNCCSAYISQSTSGFRSLLVENELCFSMPLCRSAAQQAAADDLVELSEIEKCNLGQAQHSDLSVDIDNSPESLLAFLGNKNVHALFDFLLNYRFFLSSLSSSDVPVLYSPVTFKNASVFSPEVRCKQIRRADFLSSSVSDTEEMEPFSDAAATSVCHSIEIKDEILPPWVISGICAAMASQSAEFEASFLLDKKSVGLNIALDSLCQNPEMRSGEPSDTNFVGVAETITVPWLQSAYLTSLKHSKGSYTACVGHL